MSAKDILEELKATEELIQRGWTKDPCKACNGDGLKDKDKDWPNLGFYPCYMCDGRGWNWKAPTTK